MKSLLAAVVVAAACSVSVSAFAQSSAPDNGAQTQAQATTAQSANDQAAAASNGANDRYARTRNQSGRYDPDPSCVGPVSFCNIYFGS